jgi:hypothetical protein
MRDPNYVRHHPTAGVSGTQRIYRYDNGLGATVDWLYNRPGWTLTPVKFYGMEITSFNPDGAPIYNMNEDDVHAKLDEIAALPPAVVRIAVVADVEMMQAQRAEEEERRAQAAAEAKQRAEYRSDYRAERRDEPGSVLDTGAVKEQTIQDEKEAEERYQHQ